MGWCYYSKLGRSFFEPGSKGLARSDMLLNGILSRQQKLTEPTVGIKDLAIDFYNRYPQEIALCKEMGFTCLRVFRKM